MKTMLLSREDVAAVLSLEGAIAAVEEGYLAYARGRIDQPAIVSLEMPENGGETDIKSCYNHANQRATVKVASLFKDNGVSNDLPRMIGMIILLDGKSGAPLCVMDGSLITGIRTGAAGAISCRLLARKDAKRVAVFGGGGQARMQIYALCKERDIQTVNVFSHYPEELIQYKKDVEKETGVKVVICSRVEAAMDGVDIAISTTPSKEYFIDASLVRPGMHIVAVGADMAGKNEWDPAIFAGAKVVCDSVPQCISLGETRNPVEAGIINEEDIHGEIGQLLRGEKALRESDREITIFDTTGMAVQDNVTAARIYEEAKERGLGGAFAFL